MGEGATSFSALWARQLLSQLGNSKPLGLVQTCLPGSPILSSVWCIIIVPLVLIGAQGLRGQTSALVLGEQGPSTSANSFQLRLHSQSHRAGVCLPAWRPAGHSPLLGAPSQTTWGQPLPQLRETQLAQGKDTWHRGGPAPCAAPVGSHSG